jgi:heat shock protein HslJ
VKLEDLDDHEPIEPDDGLLATVHARSRSFRRRRTKQRLTSATASLAVVALVVGIASTRTDTSNRRLQVPAASSTTNTVAPAATMTQDAILGRWRPVVLPPQVNKGPLIATPAGRPDPYLSFNGRGEWTGSDGCNEIGGTYRLDANGVRFDTEGSTAVACGADHPDFAPIELAARSEIRDDQLTFLDSDGKEIARFERSGVTARIELPTTTMTAGSKMTAHVVIENNTGHVIEAGGCGSLFAVMLGNEAIHPKPVWPLCNQPLPIPIGETTYPVTVLAAYQVCSPIAQGTLPLCTPGGGPAPLPWGDYQAQFFQSSPVVTPALPIDVTVTPQTTTITSPPAAVTQDLITGKWQPVSIAGYDGQLTSPWITFDGRASWIAFDGCNYYNGGTYTLTGTEVVFGSASVTQAGCVRYHSTDPSPLYPDFEPIVGAAHIEMVNGALVFSDADGTEIARFEHADVTARIELPSTTMPAGSKMTGHVVIENNTGHEIHAGGCGSLFAVLLGDAAYHPDPMWRACAQDIVIPVGETSYEAQVFATYTACDQTGTNGVPRCLSGSRMPPLPPGNYQAQFFQSSPVVTPAVPIDVTVTP